MKSKKKNGKSQHAYGGDNNAGNVEGETKQWEQVDKRWRPTKSGVREETSRQREHDQLKINE